MIRENLNNHYRTIEELAARVHIDVSTIDFCTPTNGAPITRGIHLDKEYEGKVYCYVNHWQAPNGKTYLNVTFGTHKHGGITETFNGYKASHKDYEEFERPTRPKTFVIKQAPKPDKNEGWRKKELEAAHTAWDNASSETVATHPYIISKGISVEGLSFIRRGIGKFGDCLMVQIKDMDGEVIGYHQIYENRIPNKDTNKHFVGAKKGGFVVIGDASKVKDGAYYCEGLATGLSIYNANGDGKTTLNNRKRLPVVVCLDAGNLKEVIALHDAAGCVGIRIAPDNDCGKESGNTGIFVALQIAREVGIKKIYVPQKDGAKCDFNDTLEFKKITVGKSLIEYYLQLLEVCPIAQVKKYGEEFAKVIAQKVPYPYSKQAGLDLVTDALTKRGVTNTKTIEQIINRSVERRTKRVKALNTICNKLNLNLHIMSDWTNEQIAASIQAAMFGNIWLDNRGLGAGKTKLLEIMRKLLNDCGIAYVTHRVSLVKDACGRLDIANYNEVDPSEHVQHLGVCVNSMPKFNAAVRFNILFLDEARQIIEHCSIGTVDNRQEVSDILAKAIEAADIVIASDADLNDDTVDYIKRHANGKKLNWIFTTAPKNNKTIHLLKDIKAIRVKILNALADGDNVIVACTSKAESIRMHTFLLEAGMDASALLLVHADNKGDTAQATFLANPNVECVKYKCVIHSPTIGSGVSIETEHFKTNFMLDSGNLPANECLQMTARNRCSDSIFYAFASQNNFSRCTDTELLIEGDKEKWQNHSGSGNFKLNELGWLRVNHIANKHEDLNDHPNTVLILADLKGMTIDYSELHNDINPEEAENQKGLAKRVKEQRATDIIEAEVIDTLKVQHLSEKNALTQSESNQLDRYLATKMAGTHDIDIDDARNFLKGSAAILTNYEIIHANIEKLKSDDRENALTQNKLQSKSSLHKIFNAVLDAVKDDDRIEAKTATKACNVLEKYAAELAANGFGDYRKPAKDSVKRLNNFLKKIGYKLDPSLKTEWERFYQVKPIEHIQRYASNREALRLALTGYGFLTGDGLSASQNNHIFTDTGGNLQAYVMVRLKEMQMAEQTALEHGDKRC